MKEERFLKWDLHYIFIFFYLVIFHESQTQGPMAIKKI